MMLPANLKLVRFLCRTVAAVQALNSGHFGQGLELLNIQRCFRIWTADYSLPLLELLTGAGSPAHCLRTLLLSHISSLDGLKVVLEHDNESTLGPSLLDEDAYPQSGVPPAAVLRSPVQRVGLVGQRLRILALHNCGKIQVEHLLALAAASSKLEVLCLGGSNVNGQRVDEVADAFSRFQQLRLLEVTFWGGQGAWSSGKADGSVSCGATLLATLRASLSYNQQQRRVRVWDLCNAVDLEEAHAWFHSQASAHERSALSAAANCSDARRRTPLHVAASRGDTVSVVRLLALGASAGGDRSVTGDGPRDVGGATALFLAAESGHVGCVDALIRGGANVLAANRGNESPLYIASLKGHCDVVAVMLQHCHERSLEWQDAKVYGEHISPTLEALFKMVKGRPTARHC